jgi:hypothetical protein
MRPELPDGQIIVRGVERLLGQQKSVAHGSGSTLAAMSGARVTL